MKKSALLILTMTVAMGAGCNQAQTTMKVGQPAGEGQEMKVETQKPALDACKLLTPEIAKSVIGEETAEPSTNNVGGVVSTCSYSAKSANMKSLSLLARRAYTNESSVEVFKAAFDQSKSLSGVDPVSVSGLGDEAYWAGGTLNQLNVRKGDTWLILSSFGFDKGMDAEKLRQPMESIIKNF